MKKLFLSSSFKDVASLFEQFEENLQGRRVTFIPTASVPERIVFYVKAGKKALEKMGLIVDVLEVSTATPAEIRETLAKNDFIYVSGGNTFFLMQELRRSGADKIIVEEVNAGKLYIGESAGAVVASASIEYVAAMDSVKKAPNLQGFEGLGLTNFYTVPHHTNAPFKKAVEKVRAQYGEALELRLISNKQALTVCGDEVRVLGDL